MGWAGRWVVSRAALAAVALLAPRAEAAWWISAPPRTLPACAPVPLYWFTIDRCPVVYRTEIEVRHRPSEATVLARSSGYLYVAVDGRQVYGWTPDDRPPVGPPEPISPARLHAVDLSGALTAGRHVLTVQAPPAGFVLDGGAGWLHVQSDAGWRVFAVPATTVVEHHAISRPGFTGGAAVRRGGRWHAPDRTRRAAAQAFGAARARADDDEATWRARLLAESGQYVVDGAAHGWAGPLRLDAKLRSAGARIAAAPPAAGAGAAATKLHAVEALSTRAYARDEARALALLEAVLDGADAPAQASESDLGRRRARLERRLGAAANHLNESRFDRLGWMETLRLIDADAAAWGVRLNSPSGPGEMTLPQPWRFATDPDDRGMQEMRWSTGYNVDDAWPLLFAFDGWKSDPRFADYRGIGWYRGRFHVPTDWSGEPLELRIYQFGPVRVWLNDRELPARAEFEARYAIPPELVAYGAENLLAVRGPYGSDNGGIGGPIVLGRPAPPQPAAPPQPRVEVFATPLAPAVVWRAQQAALELRHAGQLAIGRAASGGLRWTPDYSVKRDGRLATNWLLLDWADGVRPPRAGPILLVFERNPIAVATAAGVTRIELPRAGEWIVAVRPWAAAPPPAWDGADVAPTLALWSHAARALPINFLRVTRVRGPGVPLDASGPGRPATGPLLEQTTIYDYLRSVDEWRTEALELAPLPSLASYALERRGDLTVDGPVEVLQAGHPLVAYRGRRDADRVTYRYRVEPFARLIGFTTWMFTFWDAGVPGNVREAELLAAAGANSLRAQHNFADERPPPGSAPPGETRTQLAILADACNAAGLNYMHNIDQGLGAPLEFVHEHYEELLSYVGAHYDAVVRQLAPRPFGSVAYDLINEPNDHDCRVYNRGMRELTARIRAVDPRHLLSIEPCGSWSAVDTIDRIEPTGDPLTLYSFHDYSFRIEGAAERWPTPQRNVSRIYERWLPAILYQAEHGVPLHCGEYGDFAGVSDDDPAQALLLNDLFRVFDQFGMHHHYYPCRSLYRRQADGSLLPSYAVRAFRDYAAQRKRFPPRGS